MKWILAILTLCGCAGINPTPTVLLVPLDDYNGLTICDQKTNRITVLLNILLAPDSAEMRRTFAHELIHVGQMRKFPNCKTVNDLYNHNPKYRFSVELQAYCPAYNEFLKIQNPDRVRASFFQFMFLTYGSPAGLSEDEVQAAINSC